MVKKKKNKKKKKKMKREKRKSLKPKFFFRSLSKRFNLPNSKSRGVFRTEIVPSVSQNSDWNTVVQTDSYSMNFWLKILKIPLKNFLTSPLLNRLLEAKNGSSYWNSSKPVYWLAAGPDAGSWMMDIMIKCLLIK